MLFKDYMMHKYEKDIEYTNKLLGFFISEKYIKTPEEAALTFAIIKHQNFFTYHEEKNQHYNEEEKSFNSAKRKMLEWISKIDKRAQRVSPVDVDAYESAYKSLYEEIDALDYVSVNSITDLLSEKRKTIKNIYISSGLSNTKAAKITKELLELFTHSENSKLKDVSYIDSSYEELYSIITGQNVDIAHRQKKLVSLDEDYLLVLSDDDSYTSMKLKFSALKALLSDDFQTYSDEIYRANCSVDNYPINIYMPQENVEDFIEEEKSIFKKYGKSLTHEHIEKIILVDEMLHQT